MWTSIPLHATHGRALTFATGIKLANPGLHVICVMGDGDATAIGGNHFIHAARRNINLTALIINNSIYGMTGGQYSPTTPFGHSTTSVYGPCGTRLLHCRTSRPLLERPLWPRANGWYSRPALV